MKENNLKLKEGAPPVLYVCRGNESSIHHMIWMKEGASIHHLLNGRPLCGNGYYPGNWQIAQASVSANKVCKTCLRIYNKADETNNDR